MHLQHSTVHTINYYKLYYVQYWTVLVRIMKVLKSRGASREWVAERRQQSRDETKRNETRRDETRAEQRRDATRAEQRRDATRAERRRDATRAERRRDATRAEQRRDGSRAEKRRGAEQRETGRVPCNERERNASRNRWECAFLEASTKVILIIKTCTHTYTEGLSTLNTSMLPVKELMSTTN